MTPVNEGEILAGKYRVERVLGVGGMGVVVAALHIALDERVAIKFLLPEALTNAEAVARFAREARAAVKIKSQHVARVIDVGTLETGAPYMVMEFLKGQDLSNHLRQHGALPIADAVDFVLQACEALAEAHALGIVHRDLKPSNLYLTHQRDGTPVVKVLDFGISKVSGDAREKSDGALTRTSALMGFFSLRMLVFNHSFGSPSRTAISPARVLGDLRMSRSTHTTHVPWGLDASRRSSRAARARKSSALAR